MTSYDATLQFAEDQFATPEWCNPAVTYQFVSKYTAADQQNPRIALKVVGSAVWFRAYKGQLGMTKLDEWTGGAIGCPLHASAKTTIVD
ncbi:hypothetical protein RB195_009544 [Necator americanus]|uniref:Uncharacterized protein n=1 Tax=Necator americanus TaxID=51031 RepID=A0ABR1CTR6_NECAM